MAVVLLAASLGVVLTPNLFHAVLYLAAALVATGVVFLLLDAPFLFGVQLLALRRRRGHHRGLRDHAHRAAGGSVDPPDQPVLDQWRAC